MIITSVPESIIRQVSNPSPDIEQFIAVIKGRRKPQKVHLAELFADQEIMQWCTENLFGEKWTAISEDPNNISQMKAHLLCEIEYWYRMGYDYIRVTGGVTFDPNIVFSKDTAGELARSQRGWANMRTGPIQSWRDFESYPWPRVKDESVWMYEFVSDNLPGGMGIFVCPTSGFLEIPMEKLIGFESLSMMIYDEPSLVEAVFSRVRETLLDVYRRTVELPKVTGFFQGDDMGFKTGTLLNPQILRKYCFPGHRALAQLAHSRGKLYFLHCCGKLDQIMDELITDIGIDAKQSFEDVIMPVEQFHNRYAERIGTLGGLDIGILAEASCDEVSRRSRQILDSCMPKGRYAFGSGNTVANYCKMDNVLAMFAEAFKWPN